MPMDIFEKGAGAIVVYILVALVLTILEYAPVPILFAVLRNKGIGKGMYRLITYGANLLIMILMIVITGEVGNGGPYVLWTTVFTTVGIKIMDKKGIIF